MYYSEEEISELVRSKDILTVIGRYVNLEQHGNKWFGACPFHKETSPSFMVDPVRQTYYCFGCGKGGDAAGFLMDYLHISYEESLVRLGAQKKIRSDQDSELREEILTANRVANSIFVESADESQEALAYIAKRGLSQDTVRQFGIGFCDEDGDRLYRTLRSEGISKEALEACQIFNICEDGKIFNKFAGRLTFPIRNIHGAVIGFGGRILTEDTKRSRKGPKYLNSPETPVFDKSSNLFGLDIAKDSKKGYFILCEGYMDVVAMHQAGFTNAVASLGTALTDKQASLLSRYKRRVLLSYDSDGPGITAAKRAIPILEKCRIKMCFLNLKPHKDPDEFIKTEGKDAFEERLQQALSIQEWALNQAIQTGDRDGLEKCF